MSKHKNEVWAVIPAAGVGARMQAQRPKQYLSLRGRSVLDITISKILASTALAGVVVAISDGDPYWPESEYVGDRRVHVCAGGKERCDSVLNALNYIKSQVSIEPQTSVGSHFWVMVHDAARPCVTSAKIYELVGACLEAQSGGILACPAADTLKRVDGANQIVCTEDRTQIWQAHTPQFFPYGQLKTALEHCLTQGVVITDEASAVEQVGGRVMVVVDRRDNVKITVPEDLAWAEYVLTQQYTQL